MESAIALDDVDRVLIGLLQKDARASYQELAGATRLSASTARRRVERLVQSGAIKLVAVPSWSRIGLRLTAFIAISVDLHRLRAVGSELSKMSEIVFIAVVTGAYDLIAEAVLPTNEDFVRFVTQQIAPIEGIRDIQTFMIPEFIKSFEQYQFPVKPNPLYLRGGDGNYAYPEEEFIPAGARGLLDAGNGE
ncbi:MAG TPA: Lrp/AsnC family transcriptional regulator [Thermomicrobiaceae bacterium]|nr:Lrp/AsnC family transcriptional regulator [Thermomicrobiaceae bacterium]